MSFPPQFARDRDWQGGYHEVFNCSESLHADWNYSTAQLLKINEALTKTLSETPASPVRCVVAAGSYGRMEAAPHSDFDLIVIVNDDEDVTGDPVVEARRRIWNALDGLSLRLPKDWGIFIQPTTQQALIDPTSLGDLGESRDLFGKRIQLLLDSQPVYGDTAFVELQRAIVDWYATAFVGREDDSQWTYLMNDLVRYYRSYAAWHQYKLSVEHDDSWFIRNAKLRTSRLVMYAGLMLQLGQNTQACGADVDALLSSLTLTPLERVTQVFAQYGDQRGEALISHYDQCFALIKDADRRRLMVEHAPRVVSDLPPPALDAYEPIRQHSAQLMMTLTDFTLARRDDWSRRFWQYLLY